MLNLEFSKWHSIEGGEGCTGGPGTAAACMKQGMRQHLRELRGQHLTSLPTSTGVIFGAISLPLTAPQGHPP